MMPLLHYHMRFDTNIKFKGESNYEIGPSNSKSRNGVNLLPDHTRSKISRIVKP